MRANHEKQRSEPSNDRRSTTSHALELDEDMAFQRREWRAERIGWLACAMILLAIVAGATGSGPLARTRTGEEGGPLWADHTRFARYMTSTEVVIHASPDAESGDVELWIARDWLDRVEMQRIEPEPDRTEVGADRLIHVFEAADAVGPAPIKLSFRYRTSGTSTLEVGLRGGPELEVRQFVYP